MLAAEALARFVDGEFSITGWGYLFIYWFLFTAAAFFHAGRRL